MSQTLQAEAALTATDLPTYRLPSRAVVVSYCGQHVQPRAMDVDASDVAMQVASAAVDIFGGNGFSERRPLELFLRDAKAAQPYEGANASQRLILSRLIKKAATWPAF